METKKRQATVAGQNRALTTVALLVMLGLVYLLGSGIDLLPWRN